MITVQAALEHENNSIQHGWALKTRGKPAMIGDYKVLILIYVIRSTNISLVGHPPPITAVNWQTHDMRSSITDQESEGK